MWRRHGPESHDPPHEGIEHPAAALWLLNYEAGIDALTPTRDESFVLADQLQAAGNPLGILTAFWLRGELREEHVLGVELSHRAQLTKVWGMKARDVSLFEWAKADGWESLDNWSFRRPTIEARPS